MHSMFFSSFMDIDSLQMHGESQEPEKITQ